MGYLGQQNLQTAKHVAFLYHKRPKTRLYFFISGFEVAAHSAETLRMVES
jgi:hypothetical protein